MRRQVSQRGRAPDFERALVRLTQILFAQPDLHYDVATVRGLELHPPQGLSAPLGASLVCGRKILVPLQRINADSERRGDLSLRTLNVRELLDQFEINELFRPAARGLLGKGSLRAGGLAFRTRLIRVGEPHLVDLTALSPRSPNRGDINYRISKLVSGRAI
jgi:hypothetical protein